MRMLAALRTRLPWGFLGMIGLVLLVERMIVGYELDLMNSFSTGWSMAARASTRQATQSQALFLGTSMVHAGIVPSVFERRTGLKARNLGIPAGTIPAEYYLLRRALSAGAKPSIVVLDLNPFFLASDPQDRWTDWMFLLSLSDWGDMAWEVRDPAFLGRTLCGLAVPSVRFRDPLREAVLPALGGREWSHRSDVLMEIRNLNQNDGARMIGYKSRSYKGEIQEIFDVQYLRSDNPWSCLSVEYLKRIIRLCEDHGILLHAVVMPMSPALLARRRELGYDAALTRRVRRLQALAPSLVVLDARGSNYPNPSFGDAVHLSPDGALALSDDLGKLMSREINQGREAAWVDLPRFQQARIRQWYRRLRSVADSDRKGLGAPALSRPRPRRRRGGSGGILLASCEAYGPGGRETDQSRAASWLKRTG